MSLAVHTRRRWAGWWSLDCSPLTLVLAAMIVAIETLAVWSGFVVRPYAGPGFTPALPAAVVLATYIGWKHLGASRRDLEAWREPAVMIAGLLSGVAIVFVALAGSAAQLFGLFVAAFEEEVVYRMAAPLAVGGLTAWCLRRPPGRVAAWGSAPRAVALVVAATMFAVGPGHLAQTGGNLWLLSPFVAIAVLLTYVVLRTGNVIAAFATHALLNIATWTYLAGDLPHAVWAVVVILAVSSFALGARRASVRLGALAAA